MKLRFAAIVLPLILGSSVTFAAAPAAYAPVTTNSKTTMVKHHVMPTQSMMSIGHVLTRVEKAGYKNIWKIEFEHNYYEVKGFDAKGNKVKLKVDPTSGAIKQTKKLF